MKYALYLPNCGAEYSARALADLAGEAEQAGWEGFFLWDHAIDEMHRRIRMGPPKTG